MGREMGPAEELEFAPLGDAVLAHLRGEVDLANARSVKERLLEAVPNTATGLVLDLTATHHLDSSGVRVLFELAERLENRRQKLEIVVPDDAPVKRVLLLTELERVVPLFSSLDAVTRP
jgi:stage II sporulation protein AA (anti-sigma F factor antagonist)